MGLQFSLFNGHLILLSNASGQEAITCCAPAKSDCASDSTLSHGGGWLGWMLGCFVCGGKGWVGFFLSDPAKVPYPALPGPASRPRLIRGTVTTTTTTTTTREFESVQ